jgi:Fur family transcriptional regulator, peroxide stress response regulator
MSKDPGRLESMLRRLRELGFRITPQRLAVLKFLAEGRGHPGAEEIHGSVKADFPTTTLATVYKTLAVLKTVGEVLEIEFSGDHNRYDGKRIEPHPHLICIKCGRIMDSDCESLASMTEKLASRTGYEIISHRLDFFGVCPGCQKEMKP